MWRWVSQRRVAEPWVGDTGWFLHCHLFWPLGESDSDARKERMTERMWEASYLKILAREASGVNSKVGYYWEPPWDSTSEGKMHDHLCCWCACLGAVICEILLTHPVLYKIHIKKTTQVEWVLFSTFGEFSGNFSIPDVSVTQPEHIFPLHLVVIHFQPPPTCEEERANRGFNE